MIEIKALHYLDSETFNRIMYGYTATHEYRVRREGTADHLIFMIDLVKLEQPYVRRWQPDESDLDRYNHLVEQGLSLAAYDTDYLVGFAIGEAHRWNRTLWVWEFGVDQEYQRQGIGRRLMDEMEGLARQAGYKRLLCETQNTNVAAVQFYFAIGFELDALDLTYYGRDHHETAFFMKRPLT